MNVYSGFIHSRQKLETIQMAFNWGTNKQTMEYYSKIKGSLYTCNTVNPNALCEVKEDRLRRLRLV